MDNLRHYEILGISRSSSSSEVKKAYHRIARQHHPDRAKNGDVEIFKKATLAYETLNDEQRRAEYDALIDQAKLQPPKPQWFTQSPTSQAAAAAAYKASTHHSSTHSASAHASSAHNVFPEERTYRRRPQQTKFSRKSGDMYETPDPASSAPQASQTYPRPPRSAEYYQEYPETYGSSRVYVQTQSHPLSHTFTVPRASRRPKRAPEAASFVDLTGEEELPHSSRRRSFPRPPKRDASSSSSEDSSRRSAKRSAENNDNLDAESPKKKMRVFDFSEMRAAPPFTQKHGSSFQFDKINEAIHEGVPDIPAYSIPRQHNRQTSQAEAERSKQMEKAYFQSKLLLNQFTAESLPALEELFRMHKNRVHMCENGKTSPQEVLQSFMETEYILEVLLAGTRDFINHMR